MATQTALDLLLNMSAQRELGGTALQVSRPGRRLASPRLPCAATFGARSALDTGRGGG